MIIKTKIIWKKKSAVLSNLVGTADGDKTMIFYTGISNTDIITISNFNNWN